MLLSPEGASMETLKVSTKSNPNSVAGAMAGAVRNAGAVEVQVVGAGALNQAIKAVAIARGYVAAAGIDLVCIPTFADIEIDGERRTAIRLSIEDRSGLAASARVDESNNELRNSDLSNSARYAPAAATLDNNHRSN
jgi:stage V sporulation protein S